MRDKGRIVELDALRAFCMVWIVGFYHLSSYSPSLSYYAQPSSPSSDLAAQVCLGTFVFISGYVLAVRYTVESSEDALAFLWKRFLRIYPLYFLALLAFLMVRFVTLSEFVYGAFLLTMLARQPLMTLWFVSMICLFYVITPALLYRYSWCKVAVFCIALSAALILVYRSTGLVDLRLPIFMPVYCVAIIAGRAPGFRRCVASLSVSVCSLLLLACLSGAYILWFDQPMRIPALVLALLACLPLMWKLGALLVRVIPSRLIAWLSYSSFSMYLIHRITYFVGVRLYQPMTLATSILYLMFLWFPLTICFAILCQMSYDRLLNLVRQMNVDLE